LQFYGPFERHNGFEIDIVWTAWCMLTVFMSGSGLNQTQ
jgi:hypothetical protein